MKVVIKRWHAVAQWRWDTGNPEQDEDSEGDVCGICRVPYEGCCPSCKMPGDDCPLSTCIRFLCWKYELILAFAHSLGRMHPCIPYALLAQMDRNGRLKTTMSNGPQSMGYTCLSL